jgi:hypothetical protein
MGSSPKGRAHTRRYTTLRRPLLKRRGASFTGAGSTFRPGSDTIVSDTGNLRHDLLALARQTFDRLNGEDGAVTLRLIVESRFYDDLREGLSSAAHVEQLHATRAIVRRAIKRGDLPAGASVTLISDMIAGSVLNHTLVTPPHLRDAMEARSEQFFEQLVDVVLAGVEHVNSPPPN